MFFKDGASYMYTGAWGAAVWESVQRDGGKATMEETERYRPVWEEPRSTTSWAMRLLSRHN